MTTKLTLSIEKQTVKDIKRLAKDEGTSVSAMFERFARSVTQKRRKSGELGPATRKASGMLKLPRGKSDRQVLEEALMERFELP